MPLNSENCMVETDFWSGGSINQNFQAQWSENEFYEFYQIQIRSISEAFPLDVVSL